MSGRNLTARPQASADPMAELCAVDAEHDPPRNTRPKRMQERESYLATGIVWAGIGAASALILVMVFG